MKNFLGLFLVLTSLSLKASADSLLCELDGKDDSERNSSIFLADTVRGVCEGKPFEITGVGIGFQGAAFTQFMISCPSVSDGNFKGRYYGAKAGLAALVGGEVGIYFGRKGVCTIGGAEGGALGLGASGSVLTIK